MFFFNIGTLYGGCEELSVKVCFLLTNLFAVSGGMILGVRVSKAEGDKAWKMLTTESRLGLPPALTCLLHSWHQVPPP